MITLDGVLGQFCSRCHRFIPFNEPVAVTKKTRKNRLGGIAWSRDGICMQCYRKEKNEKKDNGICN